MYSIVRTALCSGHSGQRSGECEMRLQVLLSAMHLAGEDYIDTLNITTDAVVINQCDREAGRDTERTGTDGKTHRIRYIETKQRGLSKSRNLAISEADADICILCDNDVEYLPDYEKSILEGFARQVKSLLEKN